LNKAVSWRLPSVPPHGAAVSACSRGKRDSDSLRPFWTVDGSLSRNAVIIVRGDRVEQVGTTVNVPDGARVIDLSAYTVLPGLIDSHTHILLQPEDERGTPPVITKSQAFRTVQGVAAARKDLEAGFTTMRASDGRGRLPTSPSAMRSIADRPRPRMLVSPRDHDHHTHEPYG
jgi:imidazolonepropionase-like amidohydrolase